MSEFQPRRILSKQWRDCIKKKGKSFPEIQYNISTKSSFAFSTITRYNAKNVYFIQVIFYR
ncbi:hypothetical protein KsCSTR_38510 [Candidatus Kuenenia stuttgartiensis]|uniref:Uncharacterized protein n=1 Tax=Kuenenia stuttgartiensis TaxID=174633 RepID=Q1PUT3_KUEST|nr:hypothetical protein KsCSTR_38510 [Candidatus Kuenenia stuttgartiensis]CAJ70989.1 unknown protein [Candidatus Kuenenia stuttgartiensis]